MGLLRVILTTLFVARPRHGWNRRYGVSVAAHLSVLCASGCSGVYLSPGANLPALERARQVRLGASTTIFNPQSGTHANIAVAATDSLRVGGAVSGAFDRSTRRGLYGELFAGVEPRVSRFLRYGVLASVGYGQVTDYMQACDGSGEGFCFKPAGYADHVSARYWRFSAQGHLVVRAPRVVHGGAGLRVGLLAMEFSAIDHERSTLRGLPVTLEPFLMVRAGWKRFQVGPELRFVGVVNDPGAQGKKLVVPDRFVIALGFALLLGPLEDRSTVAQHP